MRPGIARSLVIVLALATGGCGPLRAERPREQPAAAPPAVEHAVQGERLEAVMRGLDRLSNERLPRALGTRDVRGPRVAEVERIAAVLADSAAEIPVAANDLGLGPAERGEFLGYAAQLEREARALARDAQALAPDALDARVAQLQDVCDTCHQRFRISQDDEASAP